MPCPTVHCRGCPRETPDASPARNVPCHDGPRTHAVNRNAASTGLARRTRCALRREDPRRGPGGPPLPAGTVVERGRATGERGGRLRGGGDRTQRRRPPV